MRLSFEQALIEVWRQPLWRTPDEPEGCEFESLRARAPAFGSLKLSRYEKVNQSLCKWSKPLPDQ